MRPCVQTFHFYCVYPRLYWNQEFIVTVYVVFYTLSRRQAPSPYHSYYSDLSIAPLSNRITNRDKLDK